MKVRTVRQSGEASLIEYERDDRSIGRVYVPTSLVTGEEIDPAVVEMGVPYGLPWEELLDQRVTPEARAAADALRRRGIWTGDDLRRNPNEAAAVLITAYRGWLHRLLAVSEEFDKEGS
jgi:hypothetical protein